MTRRDYVRLAALVRRLDANPNVPTVAVLEVMGTLADVLAEDNPRFDRETFAAACMAKEGS